MVAKVQFKEGDSVVCKTHGVGVFRGIESKDYGGHKQEFLKIQIHTGNTEMMLRVPANRADGVVRAICTKDKMDDAKKCLLSRPKRSRTMWSRRAKEYEEKIKSGDPMLIAEVVRDLFKRDENAEQSYSERQIYQTAVERLAREFAALESISQDDAITRIEEHMRKKKKAASNAA